MRRCVKGGVNNGIAKGLPFFIFRVEHFFLGLLTLKIKAQLFFEMWAPSCKKNSVLYWSHKHAVRTSYLGLNTF